jgi:pimeloyl-ACP methyl ester carboxylesterase
MKILHSFTLFCLVSIILLTSCKSGNNVNPKKRSIEYIQNDLKPDEFFPAGQVELQIQSGELTMYGFAYTADGKGPHPTVILLHGLPGNERSLDLAQNIRRAGYNVIYFNYRGTWGSKGTFGFQNAIDDAGAVVDYLTDSINIEKLRVDTTKIALAGHSMGAGIALLAGLKDQRIKSIVGVSVFNPFTLLQGEGAEGNLIGLKEYLLTLGMLDCEPNKFLDDMLAKLDSYDIEKQVSKSNKPILVIDEHQNNTYFSKFNPRQNFDYKIWNTDHAFTNRRIALTIEIVNWFDDTMLNEEKGSEK